MVRSVRDMEDFIPGIVAMTVDFFSALFVSTVMSTTGSVYLSVLFIAADLGQSLLEFREVRMNAKIVFELLQDLKKKSSRCGRLAKNPDNCNLPTLILSVARDPNAFHVVSFEGVRLTACCPHPLTREQSDILLALQQSQIYQPSTIRSAAPRPGQIRRAQITPSAPEIDTISGKGAGPTTVQVFVTSPKCIAQGDVAKKLVVQGLQLTFHCEYLVLVEYVECIVPLIFVLYKSVLEHLPNAVYYPSSASNFGASAVANTLVFAFLEIVSLLLVHLFLQRKFAFSPLYQLAFVLETQVYMVQAQLFIEGIFLLQYELDHFGKPMTSYSRRTILTYCCCFISRYGLHFSVQMAPLKRVVKPIAFNEMIGSLLKPNTGKKEFIIRYQPDNTPSNNARSHTCLTIQNT
ncbi:hypothetical protein PHYSODRAFT_504013 [Phytophthora sojae]|uniref:Uncharacterized protein n=1 Tax=Phytophthora sojae (strain P6497) TaxID=1094619 RepID=G4ZG57_PHYSP|nr:hypothetical protein PHYSODRAFT_504013 [Phytophthora sojae]EGZ17541.1 hypothetical protein PHYSODRAFT_504013 [Phytophthora sojae]|eukprot:XP_009526599.1 hypothetical protein PHYSODRAFT_504013 [Phytophthora sojae]